jgi:hypothetical protein
VKPSCSVRRSGGVKEIFLRNGEPLGDVDDSRLRLWRTELVEVILIRCLLCDKTTACVKSIGCPSRCLEQGQIHHCYKSLGPDNRIIYRWVRSGLVR